VHQLAAAVEGNDIARAIKLPERWQPPRTIPAERRSHFYIEAARAYRMAGNTDKAIAALRQARQAAPQHTRYNPVVSETVHALILGRRCPPLPLLRLAAWLGLT
jgi:tetratricopeptide repeat protein